MPPNYYFNDFDERFRYVDLDGHHHDVPLRDLSVEQVLAVVKFYKLKREADWNVSPLTEKLRAAMHWQGEMRDIDKAIRRYWPDRDFRAKPFRDA
jgi:hypothetical protein